MPKRSDIRVRAAGGPRELGHIRDLFLEYAASLNFDLCFQGFDEELAGLPGAYAPPRGRLFLAEGRGGVAGGVGIRPLAAEICEMKRLYVRPAFRNLGIGRRLSGAALKAARAIGYRRMRLETLSSMAAANALYAGLGFKEIPPYCDNPLESALYFERLL